MGAAPGIAGSQSPEKDGIFLCLADWDVEYFVRMNNTGGPVDVWAVDGVDRVELVDNGNGYFYFPGRISPSQVTLVRREATSALPGWDSDGSSAAYQSSITVTPD
jgi:hypothetical protein